MPVPDPRAQGPPGPQGPPGVQGPGGPAGGLNAAQLQTALAPLLQQLTALAPLPEQLRLLAARQEIILAKLENQRRREQNKKLRSHEQWQILQREAPQQLNNGVLSAAPGDVPPGNIVPTRGLVQADPVMTAGNLQMLSAHYGVIFADWTAFEDFLKG